MLENYASEQYLSWWWLKALLHCVQFSQRLATQRWKNVLSRLPRWSVTPCNAIWPTSNDLRRKSLGRLATGALGPGIGHFSQYVCAMNHACEKLRCKCWMGFSLCNGDCKLLQPLEKVEPNSTCRDPPVTPCKPSATFGNLQRITVVLRCKVLEKLQRNSVPPMTVCRSDTFNKGASCEMVNLMWLVNQINLFTNTTRNVETSLGTDRLLRPWGAVVLEGGLKFQASRI